MGTVPGAQEGSSLVPENWAATRDGQRKEGQNPGLLVSHLGKTLEVLGDGGSLRNNSHSWPSARL